MGDWERRKGGDRRSEEGKEEGPGNPEAGAGQVGQEMRGGQRELELQDSAVTSVSGGSSGRRKGLCGAHGGSGNLRKQWTSVRRAGADSAPDAGGGGVRAQAGSGRGLGLGTPPAGRRACGQRGGPPAAPRARRGSASRSLGGGSGPPLAAAAAGGRGSAARKKCNCVKKSSPG